MKPLAFWKVPGFIRRLYPGTVWEFENNSKKIFLTFDDGPAETVTPEVLEILARYDAGATFFCIGRNVERHPELFNALIAAGHSVGNHTYSHVKGWYMSDNDYFADIELASQLISTPVFRPPYGLITPSQAKTLALKYRIIMWSTLSVDYDKTIPAGKSLDHIIQNTKPGSIVVFHDSLKASSKMLDILPKYLDHFSSMGYKFESIK